MTDRKIPPHNLEAEKAFLCCVMTDNYALVRNGINLDEKYFYSKVNRTIFKAVSELQAANVQVDIITLKTQLMKANKLTEVGGVVYLMEIMNSVSTSANTKHYADLIIENYKLRTIIANSAEAIESAYQLQDAGKIIGNLNTAILDNHAEKGSEPVTMFDYLPAYNEQQQQKLEAKSPGISTGFMALDAAIGGLVPGTLNIIAARPGMGKSQLALQLCGNAARAKKKSGFLSLEMNLTELTNRLIASRTGILYNHLRNPYLQTADDRSKLAHYSDQIAEIGKYLVYDYCPNLTLSDLVMKIRLMKFKHNIETVAIDYLGLMDIDTGRNDNLAEAIGKVTSRLKVLAGELGIAIILLAQLNREVEKRPDKRPVMSDLRSSGNIEQDADLIIMLYREYYYNRKDINAEGRYIVNLAEAIIAKQRNGAPQTVELRWEGSTVTFYEETSTTVQELF